MFLARRRNRPMFFIDIAVPRDVDPAINKLDGIFVYDIDDLQQAVARHVADRSKEAERAEAIVTMEVERFQARLQTLDVVPTIVSSAGSSGNHPPSGNRSRARPPRSATPRSGNGRRGPDPWHRQQNHAHAHQLP